MNKDTDEWASFAELVTWASWSVIKGITSGEPIERVMHHIIRVVREAKFKK